MTVVTIATPEGTRTVTGRLIGEPSISGQAGEWEQQDLSLRDPLLVYKSRQLLGGAMNVHLTGDVSDQIRWLRRYARGDEGRPTSSPSLVSVDTEGAWELDKTRHPAWLFVIRAIDPQDDEEYLSYGPRGKNSQLVGLEFARWRTAAAVFSRGGKSLPESAAVKSTTKATAKDEKYGLVFVSVRIYGTAGRVADLMRVNNIRDPKKIKKGQVIKLP